MKNLLQKVQTYSFLDYDEVLYFINKKLAEETTEFSVQKQVSTLDSGEELYVWILTVVEDFV